MHTITVTGRVGSVRVNAVNDERDACNVRLVKNGSIRKRDGEGYEDVERWISAAFFRPKGGFDKMKDTTFRVGNVVEVTGELIERKRTIGDTEISELQFVGHRVQVLHWTSKDGKSADAGSTGTGDAGGNAGGFDNGGFDDDIPF